MITAWYVLGFLLRVSIGMMLILTGWAKVRSGKSEFLRSILAYDLLPSFAAQILALILPVLEFIVGILILLGLFTKISSAIGLVLLIVVTGALVIALIQGKSISCGCQGKQKEDQRIRWTLVLRNSCFVIALVASYLAGGHFLSLDVALGPLENWVSWLTGLVIIGCALGCVTSIQLGGSKTAVSDETLIAEIPQ